MPCFSSLKLTKDPGLFSLIYVKQQWLQLSLILRQGIKIFFKFCKIRKQKTNVF